MWGWDRVKAVDKCEQVALNSTHAVARLYRFHFEGETRRFLIYGLIVAITFGYGCVMDVVLGTPVPSMTHECVALAAALTISIHLLLASREGGRKAPAIRILLIEDDRLVSGMIRDTLALEKWDVSLREDGQSALAEIEGTTPYDLILTDYELPGVDGLGLARAARAMRHRRRTPIIMFTASLVEREAREAGVDSFLRKPEDVGRLVEVVKTQLGHG